MTELVSSAAAALALALWREQIARGLVPDDYDPLLLWEWLVNRTYPLDTLERAAAGDVVALVEVRREAGLPVFV